MYKVIIFIFHFQFHVQNNEATDTSERQEEQRVEIKKKIQEASKSTPGAKNAFSFMMQRAKEKKVSTPSEVTDDKEVEHTESEPNTCEIIKEVVKNETDITTDDVVDIVTEEKDSTENDIAEKQVEDKKVLENAKLEEEEKLSPVQEKKSEEALLVTPSLNTPQRKIKV